MAGNTLKLQNSDENVIDQQTDDKSGTNHAEIVDSNKNKVTQIIGIIGDALRNNTGVQEASIEEVQQAFIDLNDFVENEESKEVQQAAEKIKKDPKLLEQAKKLASVLNEKLNQEVTGEQITNALKEAGCATLEVITNHPVAKIAIAAAKGLTDKT